MSLCMRNTLPALRRHNAILMLLLCELIASMSKSEEENIRLLQALNSGSFRLEISSTSTIFIDSELEGKETGFGQRPDVLVIDKCKMAAILIDVTVAFECRPDAFDAAREMKKPKYASLCGCLSDNEFKTPNDALVVGALRSWDPEN